MPQARLHRLDLNLLVVFEAVMRERHVTRASERLFMSQPAVSSALNRLRHSLRDELFVRSPEGMKPTPRALQLVGPVRAALAELEHVLEPAEFHPATTHWTFRIVANDYFSTVVLPRLSGYLSEHAPNVDLRLLPHIERAQEYLDDRQADFAFAAFGTVPERFALQTMMEDEFVCIMQKNHPLAQTPLTLDSYATASHLLVAPTGQEGGLFDTYLEQNGYVRRIAVTVNQFAAAPAIVANSALVVTLLRRVAHEFGSRMTELASFPLPFPQESTNIKLMWHTRLTRHPAYDWFRKTVGELTASL